MNAKGTPRIPTLRSAAKCAAASGHIREAEGIYRRVLELIARTQGEESEEYAECERDLQLICSKPSHTHNPRPEQHDALG